MMTNQNNKPAGSIKTTWELRTYDAGGNAEGGYDVNNTYSAGTIELRIPQTRYNVGAEWYVCRNPECPGNNPCGHTPPCGFGAHRREAHGVIPIEVHEYNAEKHGIDSVPARFLCPECEQPVALEFQEFIAAYPTDRQIKRAFGVNCRIDTDGDDLHITVTRQRDGYPLGEMHCTSHESLSPVRVKKGA